MIVLRIGFICILFMCIKQTFSNDELITELEIADLELIDDCDYLSHGWKTALLQNDFEDKIVAEKAHGDLLRRASNILRAFDSIPVEVEKNWTYLANSGDGLLSEEDWNTLVSYHNANEELVSVIKLPCLNNTDGCVFSKGDYQTLLKNSKDVDLLNNTWFAWQHVFNSNTEQSADVLGLLKKAAIKNNKEDVTSYWEYLTDYVGGYSKAREFWEEIKPFYLKLHDFVKKRLYNNYGLDNNSSEIPVYLLGSNFGNDWSYIADTVLPHPQLHYDAEFFLKYKTLREIYSLAENLTNIVFLDNLGDKFWSNSKFNMTFCEPHILSFCSREYTEVYDCNESSWVTYLNAHETAFEIAMRNQDYTSLMRQNLRYSAISDAIVVLGSLLAIESLPYHGIVHKDTFNAASEDDNAKMTKLLLIALRVVPKLPYYLAADEWRLRQLENPSEDIATSWWQFRKDYQLVKGLTGAEYDFLRDKYITSNKPYLSKFFGIILAFQIMDHYRNLMVDPNGSLADEIGNDPNFLSMIRDRPITDWPYLLTLNYGFDLSATSLLEYFKPLERYLEIAPLAQSPIVTATVTTTTTTPYITTTPTYESLNETVIKNENAFMNGSLETDIVLSDEPKINATQYGLNNKENLTSNVTMYFGVGIVILVSCMLATAYVYKHIRRRRRRTNNRRFAT